jgi:diguanylate cyclase (GGDEF)-like protein/PAS domain S-box-containing protein
MPSPGSSAPPGSLAIQLQPQVSLRDGTIEGAEVLARWRTACGRMLGPAEFMPLLGVDWTHPMFGRPLLARAIDAQVRLSAAGCPTRLWVNLAPSMLESTDWLQRWLIDPCRDAGVPVSSFGFELTETALLKSFDDARDVLATLQALGALVALDDFGTGFSSLSHLRGLPASLVKIDKSFVATVDQQLNESAIIGAVTDLAHTLGMRVLCEGVETRWQAVAVANLGADAGQGYLFGHPVDVDAFAPEEWGGVDPIETAGFSTRRADMMARPGYTIGTDAPASPSMIDVADLTGLIDATGDVVVMLDDQARITWCSASIEQMLGRDAASLVGTPALDLIHPDHLEGAIDRFVRELTTPAPGYAPDPYRVPLGHADGSWIDVHLVAQPVFDGANPLGMMLCARHAGEFPAALYVAFHREAQFAALLASSPATIVVVADDATVVEINDHVEALVGRPAHEIIGHPFTELIDVRDLEQVAALWGTRTGDDEPRRPIRMRDVSGRRVWAEMAAERWTSGAHGGFVVSIVDVTGRVHAEHAVERRRAIDELAASISSAALSEVGEVFLRRLDEIVEPVRALAQRHVQVVLDPPDGATVLAELDDGQHYVAVVAERPLEPALAADLTPLMGALCRVVFQVRLRMQAEAERRTAERHYRILSEGSSDLVIACDPSGILTFVSSSVERSVGWAPDEVIGTSILDYFHPDDLPGALAHFQPVRAGEPTEGERRLRDANGTYRWFRIRAQPIMDPETGELVEVHAAGHDTTDHHRLAEQLTHLATHDKLTGLGNRQMLTDVLDQIQQAGGDVAVVMIDLDRFKVVNDVLGHDAGDALLIDAARVIEHVVDGRGTAVRHGGDEFVVVCDGLDLHAATDLAEALARIEVHPPAHPELVVRVSAGLAWHRFPWTESGVMRHADDQVYRAKRAGGARAVAPDWMSAQDTIAGVSG